MKKYLALLFLILAPALHAGSSVTWTVTTSSFTYDSSLGTWLDGGVTRGLVTGIVYQATALDPTSGVRVTVFGNAVLVPQAAYPTPATCIAAIQSDTANQKSNITASLNQGIKATTTTQFPASAKVPSINGADVTPP